MKTTRSLTGGWPLGLRRGHHRLAIILAITAISLPTLPAYADYAAGLKAYTAGDYKAAFQEWRSVATSSDAQQAQQAEHGLGVLYERGLVTGKVDMTWAISWYQKAADQGFADSENNLAMIYLDGRGVAKNPRKAIVLWTKAAESGHTLALFNLGIQYLNGVGVAKNERRAADFIARAAEGNLSQAQFVLSMFYREGTGVKKDAAKSYAWLKRSAENGNAMAQSEVDQMPSPGGADQVATADNDSNATSAKRTVTEKAASQSVADTAPVADKTATDKSAPSSATSTDAGATPTVTATGTRQVADAATASQTKAGSDQAAATKAATAPATQKNNSPALSDSKQTDTAATAEQKTAAQNEADKQVTPPVSKPENGKPADNKPTDNKPADGKQADDKVEGTSVKTPPAPDSAKEPTQVPDGKAADSAPAKPGTDDLATAGLKKSVTGTPAFAANQAPSAEMPSTTNDQAGKAPEDKASEGNTPGDKSTQDKAAAQGNKATLDKPLEGKPEADKAETAPKPPEQAKLATADTTGEIISQSSSGAKEPLPNNTPVAESLDGPDKVYRIWLASKGTSDSARSEWDRLLQKYPNILKKLEPDIRQYYYNQEQGSIYRLFVGPFTSLEAAQKICGDIHERYQEEFCRTVIN